MVASETGNANPCGWATMNASNNGIAASLSAIPTPLSCDFTISAVLADTNYLHEMGTFTWDINDLCPNANFVNVPGGTLQNFYLSPGYNLVRDFPDAIDTIGYDAVTCGPRKYSFSPNCLEFINTDVDDTIPRAFIYASNEVSGKKVACKLNYALALYPLVETFESFSIEVCYADSLVASPVPLLTYYVGTGEAFTGSIVSSMIY